MTDRELHEKEMKLRKDRAEAQEKRQREANIARGNATVVRYFKTLFGKPQTKGQKVWKILTWVITILVILIFVIVIATGR